MRKIIECKGKDVPFGSYLENDIVNDSNVLLLKAGTIVDSHIKSVLDKYMRPIRVSIEISDKVKDEIAIGTVVKDDNALSLDADIKERALQGVEYMYSNPTSDSSVTAAKDVSSMLLDVTHNSSAVNISLNSLKVSDDYTFKHCIDVATMGILVAQKLNLAQKDVEAIALAGILHDLGKTQIPNEILNKPGKLTNEEFKTIQQHPVFGYHIIKDNKDLPEFAKTGILFHHEKVDGTGYPLKLTSEKISLSGKLLTVVDVYDALVTKRPYRDEIIEPASAIEMMMSMSNQFNIEILRTFLNCLVLYPIGTNLLLSDNNVYTVVAQNTGYPLRPVVKSVLNGETVDLLHDMKYLSLTILSSV